MRRWAFVVMIIGMFVLLLLLEQKPVYVGGLEDLENLEVNQKVSIGGEVITERVIYGNRKVLGLNREIELVCECFESFKDREVNVIGLVKEYEGKKQIRVLKIATQSLTLVFLNSQIRIVETI